MILPIEFLGLTVPTMRRLRMNVLIQALAVLELLTKLQRRQVTMNKVLVYLGDSLLG